MLDHHTIFVTGDAVKNNPPFNGKVEVHQIKSINIIDDVSPDSFVNKFLWELASLGGKVIDIIINEKIILIHYMQKEDYEIK